jgi:hypothetical protein
MLLLYVMGMRFLTRFLEPKVLLGALAMMTPPAYMIYKHIEWEAPDRNAQIRMACKQSGFYLGMIGSAILFHSQMIQPAKPESGWLQKFPIHWMALIAALPIGGYWLSKTLAKRVFPSIKKQEALPLRQPDRNMNTGLQQAQFNRNIAPYWYPISAQPMPYPRRAY